ncbi:hypothetical protein CPAR01_06934 [Colletotrichum paranaense]|uniref:Uncharacterized protein n=11 Tax=Colletotrichum acutatum species complex TaxID=2707335 RepID=A0A010RHN5_9PEZI|nr:uncharacterized protein HER10_EVM0005168 [Colletotrichum scovillei]XP_049143022.1 uncharacterized protein CLUP02_06882 [Colletotrichum lupini]XP_053053764.1 uncharacterized protein COL516b_001952 [Colletotrichum fioriniae]XP_060306274.1 uncharacterized protein CCOS01_14947 [Colletotrichum costaricense]XP_060350079.1 uncharacterized protein CPAR01_06934 [Colletotrichum paranaense]XP_060361561.1 uncharacterized protein BDZ83DRAFT_585121 [Colletotrichum acutatum]XP_060374234.1 uncharacterized
MPSTTQMLSALAVTAVAGVQAAMGPAFSTGPVASDSFIREATSTLVLPAAPSNNKGSASLWVGMGTSNGDLIQSIADNSNYDNTGTDKWSIFAYTLLSTGANSQMPVQTEGTDASEGDKITMHYKFDDASQNYTQTVSINDKVVATLSTKDGEAQGWGSAVECAAEDCGTVGAHSWINTKIILDKADANYINTMGKGNGVTGDMSTSDGGKTWTVTTIDIPEFTFGQ